MSLEQLTNADPQVASIIRDELDRQRSKIELIASENFTSLAVMEAVGSVLTNKYAEGYPGKRYYGGCEKVDLVENLAIERARALFGCEFANVQAHSGASANFAVYLALLDVGDTVLGMSLDHGGHLTHGSPVNFSGKYYKIAAYGVDPETERIDYDRVLEIAKEARPRMIVAGASAYPRSIDFARMGEIAREVGAYLLVDMAHIAGLVAAGEHPDPFPHADVVASTSHKTLRGPRGGFVLTNDEELAVKIDKATFPGAQGGPLMHVIAGKAVAFGEALQPDFRDYAHRIVLNSAALGEGLAEGGLRLVSGGTDNHLCLVDLTPADVTGKEAEALLGCAGITVNKNTIPNEKRSPFVTSGIRLGTAAVTTRGLNEDELREIGNLIAQAVFAKGEEQTLAGVRKRVESLLESHPLYAGL